MKQSGRMMEGMEKEGKEGDTNELTDRRRNVSVSEF